MFWTRDGVGLFVKKRSKNYVFLSSGHGDHLLKVEILYSLHEIVIHNLKLAVRFQRFICPINAG